MRPAGRRKGRTYPQDKESRQRTPQTCKPLLVKKKIQYANSVLARGHPINAARRSCRIRLQTKKHLHRRHKCCLTPRDTEERKETRYKVYAKLQGRHDPCSPFGYILRRSGISMYARTQRGQREGRFVGVKKGGGGRWVLKHKTKVTGKRFVSCPAFCAGFKAKWIGPPGAMAGLPVAPGV